MRQAEGVQDFVEYRLFSQGTVFNFVCTARCGHILNSQECIEMKSQANAEYAWLFQSPEPLSSVSTATQFCLRWI
jgi:hypothetical protein